MRDLLRQFRFYLLAIILLLATVVLYSYNLRQKSVTTFFERAVLSVASPFQVAIDSGIDGVQSVWFNYLWLVDTRQENQRLKQENRELEARLLNMEEYALQNERLRKLLAFVDALDLAALPAQVVGEDVSHWSRTIVIDKGTRSGLREGLPVVASEGTVGRIIKVAPYSSRVLLITDSSSAVATLVQRTRTRGIARGFGDELNIEYALRDADISVGDVLVTSGTGGIFPKSLPLGRVTSVEKDPFGMFQRITARPMVDFPRLEEVLVVLGDDR